MYRGDIITAINCYIAVTFCETLLGLSEQLQDYEKRLLLVSMVDESVWIIPLAERPLSYSTD